MSAYTLRTMLPQDWDAVRSIYEEALTGNNASFTTACPPQSEWEQSHLPVCRLVACSGDAILGWTALSPVSSRRPYAGVAEVSLYLKREAQGIGLGAQLLLALITSSEQQGIWMLQASIFKENKASLALCAHCGFRQVGYRERIAQDRYGLWRTTILVERRSPAFG